MNKVSIVLFLRTHPEFSKNPNFSEKIEKHLDQNGDYFFFRRYGKSKFPFVEVLGYNIPEEDRFIEITQLDKNTIGEIIYCATFENVKVIGFYSVYKNKLVSECSYWIISKNNIKRNQIIANFLELNKTNYPEYR